MPSVPKEHENNFVDEVLSDNDEYLFAVEDLFKDQVFETQENVKIANQNVAALVDIGALVDILNMQTFNEITKRLQKPLKLKRTKTKVCTYWKDDPPLKILGEVNTVIETKTEFLESTFFVAETRNINLSGDTFLALGLIKIDESEHMCFTKIIRKIATHKKKRWKLLRPELILNVLNISWKNTEKEFFEITLGR